VPRTGFRQFKDGKTRHLGEQTIKITQAWQEVCVEHTLSWRPPESVTLNDSETRLFHARALVIRTLKDQLTR